MALEMLWRQRRRTIKLDMITVMQLEASGADNRNVTADSR